MNYAKCTNLRFPVGILNYIRNANGGTIDLACSRRRCIFQDGRIGVAPTQKAG